MALPHVHLFALPGVGTDSLGLGIALGERPLFRCVGATFGQRGQG